MSNKSLGRFDLILLVIKSSYDKTRQYNIFFPFLETISASL